LGTFAIDSGNSTAFNKPYASHRHSPRRTPCGRTRRNRPLRGRARAPDRGSGHRITGIINGQRGVTAYTALRLGHWFGTSPQFWMNLQQLYELRRAERTVGKRLARLPRRADPATPRRKERAKAS
jgi:hypothetical protein